MVRSTLEGIRGLKVAIIGMARSGFSAARLCLQEGAHPICLDVKRPAGEEDRIAGLTADGAEMIFGPHPLEILERLNLIVKSPGVPGEIAFLQEARGRGIPIWSEIELAARRARGPILGITGTNGKSTTTAWAADMFRACGRPHELCGNIGRPVSDAVLHAGKGAVLVAEISSFQLEDIDTFRPEGAALLNFTPDHIDRHHDLASYREAKMRIFANQSSDQHAVLGEQEDLAQEVVRRFRPRMLRFRLADRGEEGAFARGGRIGLRLGGRETILCGVDNLSLPGPHNLANALAALALAAPLGLPHEGLVVSLSTFPGLPHRLERVATIDSVLYVNDSKATNTDSLSVALDAFDAPLILLAGGRDKGQDFRPLARQVRARCRRVLLFGESADSIGRQWGEDLCQAVGDLATAVREARSVARPGEIVLLSPACASFDQFLNYEQRGDRFRELVRGLTPGGAGEKERR
jgi:UDP-N-acetylmuramoylalanine--D-glutamate ligase